MLCAGLCIVLLLQALPQLLEGRDRHFCQSERRLSWRSSGNTGNSSTMTDRCINKPPHVQLFLSRCSAFNIHQF